MWFCIFNIICEDEQPARFKKKLKDVLAKEGERAHFECLVIGSPAPKVRWLGLLVICCCIFRLKRSQTISQSNITAVIIIIIIVIVVIVIIIIIINIIINYFM